MVALVTAGYVMVMEKNNCVGCVYGKTEMGICSFCNGNGETICTFCNGTGEME